MRAWFGVLGLAAVGCQQGSAACTALSDGDWSVDGSAIGMAMTATLTMDVEGCSFAFSQWSMAMVVPDGGTVSGDTVTLTGDGFDDCAGDIAADGSIEGVCGDGSTFTMTPR